MPLIQVKVIENVFTPEQKSQIITKLTDAMVSIEGENMRPVTLVVIGEVRSGDWGIAWKALTTDAVHALAAGRSGDRNRYSPRSLLVPGRGLVSTCTCPRSGGHIRYCSNFSNDNFV